MYYSIYYLYTRRCIGVHCCCGMPAEILYTTELSIDVLVDNEKLIGIIFESYKVTTRNTFISLQSIAGRKLSCSEPLWPLVIINCPHDRIRKSREIRMLCAVETKRSHKIILCIDDQHTLAVSTRYNTRMNTHIIYIYV